MSDIPTPSEQPPSEHAVLDLADALGVPIDDEVPPRDRSDLVALAWEALQGVREQGGGRDAGLGILRALAREAGASRDPELDLLLVELLPRARQRRQIWRELRQHVILDPLRLPGWILALPGLPLISLLLWLVQVHNFDLTAAVWSWAPFVIAAIAISTWAGRRWGSALPLGVETCEHLAKRLAGQPLEGLWTRARVERAVDAALASRS